MKLEHLTLPPERQIVAKCIGDSRALNKVLERGISPDDFDDPMMRDIFTKILQEDLAGRPITLSALRMVLPPFFPLKEIAEEKVDFPIYQYIEEICRRRWYRKAHALVADISALIMTRRPYHLDDEKLRQKVLEGIGALEPGWDMIVDEIGCGEKVHQEWILELEARLERKKRGESVSITTGMPRGLDRALGGGWYPGSLYTVAARAGRGKTTFAVMSAMAAASAGAHVGFFTVEMSATEIWTKFVSNKARIVGQRFRALDLSEAEFEAVSLAAATKIRQDRLMVDHTWRGRFEELRFICQRRRRQGKLDIVFVDYLGLMRITGKWSNRFEETREIVGRLKELALELSVPIVVLAQLNRQAEESESPGKEHIADSDSVGRDSDAVILLYRANMGATMLKLDKNRWGPEATWPIHSDLAFNDFSECQLNYDAIFGDR